MPSPVPRRHLSLRGSRRAFTSSRRAFTIMEVMVATVVIVIGLVGLMDAIATQSAARSGVKDSQRVSSLLTALQERLISHEWKTLGLDAPTDAPGQGWSRHRPYNPANLFGGGADETMLIRNGIIAQSTGLTNLRVYINYFRAESLDAARQGIFDKGRFVANRAEAFNDVNDARSSFATRLTAVTPITDPDLTVSPTSKLESGEPIAIRILLVWEADSSRVFGGQLRTDPLTGKQARLYQSVLARGGN